MKLFKKIGLGLLVILGIALIVLLPKIKGVYHAMHLFDEDKIVENFRTMNAHWDSSDLIAKGSKSYTQIDNISLPESFNFQGEELNTVSFLADSRTTGLLVIQNDTIVFEEYYLGNTATTPNISWSMAKSFISTLFGIAIEEGYIDNIDQTVDEYLPEMEGTGYEGVKIKDVLEMATGVGFNENYGDFWSDINVWGRNFASGGSQDEFATTLTNEIEPGTVSHYVSINTHVLGMILVRATGKTITEYMQEKLWEPAGMEHNAYWMIDGEGMEVALGGLNATLRDFAKIGSIFLHNGKWNGNQIVSEEWVKASTTAHESYTKPTSPGSLGYGYQWWIPYGEQDEFLAMGVYNQNIYINPTTNTVIVKLSANHRYTDPSYQPSSTAVVMELFREISNKYE